jgi:hypothetical protein
MPMNRVDGVAMLFATVGCSPQARAARPTV